LVELACLLLVDVDMVAAVSAEVDVEALLRGEAQVLNEDVDELECLGFCGF
jgi:hypothetical protein